MKRRIVSILLAACMMMSLLPGTALAVEEAPEAPPACTCETAARRSTWTKTAPSAAARARRRRTAGCISPRKRTASDKEQTSGGEVDPAEREQMPSANSGLELQNEDGAGTEGNTWAAPGRQNYDTQMESVYSRRQRDPAENWTDSVTSDRDGAPSPVGKRAKTTTLLSASQRQIVRPLLSYRRWRSKLRTLCPTAMCQP